MMIQDLTPPVLFIQGKADPEHDPLEVMKQRIDSDRGRTMITWRLQTVKPVFGNTRGNKRLGRFTLRGQPRVDGQWKLYCLVHNIEKLAHHGYAGRGAGNRPETAKDRAKSALKTNQEGRTLEQRESNRFNPGPGQL